MGEITKLSHEELAALRKQIKSANPDSKELGGSSDFAAQIDETKKKITIELSEDLMEATVMLSVPEDGYMYTPAEIMGELRKRRVIKGTLSDVIIDMVNNCRYNENIVIARGLEMNPGSDGYYDFKFETQKITAPKIREDGTVDYAAAGRLQNVKEGDVVAVYHPAVAGTKGYNVLGDEKQPGISKDLPFLRGKYIKRNDETNEYTATKSGKISYDEASLNIEILDVHEINENVTLILGKVEFYGDLIINGDVENGVFIRAGRNVTISGTVGAATINAGGDIVLQKGIQGGGKGTVSARGNVFSDFIEYANIRAREDVYANSIINSEVDTEGQVVVSGKFGSIIGGRTHGLKGITTNEAGNESEVKTLLHAGFSETDYQEFSDLSKEEKELNKELSDLVVGITDMLKSRNKGLSFGKPSKSKISELTAKKNEICSRLEQIKGSKEEIARRMAKGENASITVRGTIHRNVVIMIDATPIMILNNESFTRYTNKDDVIERRTVAGFN